MLFLDQRIWVPWNGRKRSLSFLLCPPLKWGDTRLKGRKELASLKDVLTLGGSEPGASLCTPFGRPR